MSIYRTKKVEPRNGHTLVVLNANRISGCESQREMSLDDQHEHAQEVVNELYDGVGDNVEYRVFSTKGKGEDLCRPELAQIEAELRTREIDLLVLEDIGRLVRGTEAARLIGLAVDCGTRVVSPNDCIDTNDDSWEEDVISACRDHVGHNAHTSKRLKKKLMIRFKRNGQATPCPIAGYKKPDDAKSFHDWSVNESGRQIVIEGASLLRQHLNCSAVADFFEASGFPVGPYCRNKKWDGKMVRRFYNNPILKGMPERGNMHSVKHNQSGRRRSVKNPEGPVSIEMPHLAILTPADFDELKALLDAKNKSRGRKPNANGDDPLKGVQRKRTRFPGQHARCWYCGRQLVWGGNGIKENLQCKGSRNWNCWNSVAFNGRKFAKHVVAAITGMISEIDGLDDQFRDIVAETVTVPDTNLAVESSRIAAEQQKLDREMKNLTEAIIEYGPNPSFREKIEDLKDQERKLLIRKGKIDRASVAPSDLPNTTDELLNLLNSSFLSLATDSYEFGAMLPKIVPTVFVHLVRMVDGGPCYPRIRFTVDLTGSFESEAPDDLRPMLVREFTVDMFEMPKRERIRLDVIRLIEDGLNRKQIIEKLDEPLSTKMIASAVTFHEVMEELKVTDPLKVVTEPVNDFSRFRRHLNPRYDFSMEPGYQRKDL